MPNMALSLKVVCAMADSTDPFSMAEGSCRPRAICVTGGTASLTGDILVHEHLLFDFTSRFQQAASPALANDLISLGRLHQIRSQPRHCLAALRSPGVDVLMQELAALRDATGPAGCTVVDCTVVGRDAEGLLSLSQLTKVNIIMAAGVSVDEAMRAPEEQPLDVSDTAMQQDEPVDEMADRLVAELTSGIAVRGSATAVRAGILTTGEVPALAAASSLTPELARARMATLRALGRAQLRTGAPILCPLPACPGDGSGALEGVQCLIAQGARAGSIIVAHAQNLLASERREALLQLLRLGVTLCFDGLGDTWSVAGADYVDAELAPPPTDSEVAREVAALAAAGHAAQLVLSHAVSSRLQLATFGGAGLTHVIRSFVGRLRRANLSEVDVDALLGWSRCGSATDATLGMKRRSISPMRSQRTTCTTRSLTSATVRCIAWLSTARPTSSSPSRARPLELK
jgi:predicted metal-dependent phosphotriesterase family hydrolase